MCANIVTEQSVVHVRTCFVPRSCDFGGGTLHTTVYSHRRAGYE